MSISAPVIILGLALLVLALVVICIVVVLSRRGGQGRSMQEISRGAAHPKDFGPGQPSSQNTGPGAAPAAGSEATPADTLPSELPSTRDLQPPR